MCVKVRVRQAQGHHHLLCYSEHVVPGGETARVQKVKVHGQFIHMLACNQWRIFIHAHAKCIKCKQKQKNKKNKWLNHILHQGGYNLLFCVTIGKKIKKLRWCSQFYIMLMIYFFQLSTCVPVLAKLQRLGCKSSNFYNCRFSTCAKCIDYKTILLNWTILFNTTVCFVPFSVVFSDEFWNAICSGNNQWMR